ncbi:MAG: TIGR03435 family protein [Pirellulales bacterium]|nr:TIGR03435 family protein [Pirellulales bacterium]
MKQALFLSLLVVLGCSAPTVLPKTEKEFVEAYQSAFDQGQREQLLRLVKWDGVPSKLRTFQEETLALMISQAKVHGIQLVPIQWDQISLKERQSLTFNLDPQLKLYAWYQGGSFYGGQPATASVSAFVGVENGVYYICGVTSKQELEEAPPKPAKPTIPVGVELSALPNVSIKRIGTREHSMRLEADGTLRCHGPLVEILEFVCPEVYPRIRNEALPAGSYAVSIKGDSLESDDPVDLMPVIQLRAWKRLVSALEDAFEVGINAVSREEDIFRLVVADSGTPQLKKAPSSEFYSSGSGGIGTRFNAYSMDGLAGWLERDQVVVNATELKDRYDFELPLSRGSDGIDVDVYKVIAALRTVGLDLQSGRDIVDVILVQCAPTKVNRVGYIKVR